MSKKICVIGSTGLIGSTFLNSIDHSDYEQVTAITRREIESLNKKNHIKQAIYDFSDLEAIKPDLESDVLVCTLGTTIKIAGTQERFIEVDHDIPLEIAQLAVKAGCKQLILISAIGANAKSSIFYSRVKGELEDEIAKLPFAGIHILRPGILLGKRAEGRPGEFIGKIIMRSLRLLIPWKYKPIHARIIARTIHRIIQAGKTDLHFYEGRQLFDVK